MLRHLGELKLVRTRKTALPHLLGWLGLALALDAREPGAEERLLRELALPAALGRYGDCLEIYAEEREPAGSDAPTVEELIERLGGARLMERIRAGRTAAERYPSSVARLQALQAGRLVSGRKPVSSTISSCPGTRNQPSRRRLNSAFGSPRHEKSSDPGHASRPCSSTTGPSPGRSASANRPATARRISGSWS